MESNQHGASPGGTHLEDAVDARLSSLKSGNYRSINNLVLTTFVKWLQHERGIETVEAVSVNDCRKYAQHLNQRVRDDEDPLGAASAHAQGPYFSCVRAFFSWAIDEEWIEKNPARPNRVADQLPEDHGNPERQFWEPSARDALLDYVDQEARNALDDGTVAQQRRAYRDRAIVTMLALTGVRSAELFADSRDEYRDGLRWEDVDLDKGVATVFGKTREYQPVALPQRVVDVLSRYKRVLEPESASWPVAYSGGHRTLRDAAEKQLSAAGWETAEIEDLLAETTKLVPFYQEGLCPPPLTKSGGRYLMRRLCDDGDVSIEGEYLKPHGGRRALGSQLYDTDAELAQETLRHESIETTNKSYRDKQAEKRARKIDDVLSE